MQLAVVEYAENVLGLKLGANDRDWPKTLHPVIAVMPEQKPWLKIIIMVAQCVLALSVWAQTKNFSLQGLFTRRSKSEGG